MDCKVAQRQIALLIGQDLDGDGEWTVRQHVGRCPGCRKYWRRLQRSIQILQDAAPATEREQSRSVWPHVARRLTRQKPRHEFNGWMPAAAVVAACLLMFAFASGPRDAQQWHKGISFGFGSAPDAPSRNLFRDKREVLHAESRWQDGFQMRRLPASGDEADAPQLLPVDANVPDESSEF